MQHNLMFQIHWKNSKLNSQTFEKFSRKNPRAMNADSQHFGFVVGMHIQLSLSAGMLLPQNLNRSISAQCVETTLEVQNQSFTMTESPPNKTHQRGPRIVAASECCLGNAPNDKVSFPIEQNTMHQFITHSPHGTSTKHGLMAKNFMCHAAEQACGVQVPDVEERCASTSCNTPKPFLTRSETTQSSSKMRPHSLDAFFGASS